jgi:hypothetical protein
MAINNRYFWCDAPSPLHDLLAEHNAKSYAFFAELDVLAKSIGAETFVGRSRVEGAVFKDAPDLKAWRLMGKTPDGQRYYMPARNTKERKELARKLGGMVIPSHQSIVHKAGLHWMAIDGRYMQESGFGMRDGRIFIRIPFNGEVEANGGKAGPEIPAYLTECKEWEYKRWFDEGRQSEAA